jgi:ribosomal protein S13
MFIRRFEIQHLLLHENKSKSLLKLRLNKRKIFNMYLSKTISINNAISELQRYNLIRLYLIKTFRGRCHALGKPSRGQRT